MKKSRRSIYGGRLHYLQLGRYAKIFRVKKRVYLEKGIVGIYSTVLPEAFRDGCFCASNTLPFEILCNVSKGSWI